MAILLRESRLKCVTRRRSCLLVSLVSEKGEKADAKGDSECKSMGKRENGQTGERHKQYQEKRTFSPLTPNQRPALEQFSPAEDEGRKSEEEIGKECLQPVIKRKGHENLYDSMGPAGQREQNCLPPDSFSHSKHYFRHEKGNHTDISLPFLPHAIGG